jgi:hypothetical protein
MHTCAKLGIPFWDYLGDRIGIIGQVRRRPTIPESDGAERLGHAG